MADPRPLRIVKLEIAQVKRLTAVEITPDGSLVVVGGKNGAGKTSVLDSIAMALGGKDLVPELPLRRGAEHGHVEVDLGDLVVRRTFTEGGGGTLSVRNAEGAAYRSPQAILDRLVGTLSFDPLAFARLSPKEQRNVLQDLVGLDFTELDARRGGAYDERTGLNRQVKQLEAQLVAMPEDPDAPAEPVSVEALVRDLEAAQALARTAEEIERQRSARLQDAQRWIDNVRALDEQIEGLQHKRDAARAGAEDATRDVNRLTIEGASAALEVPNEAPIRERIAAAEGINAKVRANAARADLAGTLAATKRKAESYTASIEALEAEKAQALAGAAFPVPGLSFDESGVLLEGIPFGQASSAEQLRVSVAMRLAANPQLRVLLIRDGSLLDDESLALVAKMAAEAEAQVWMERVGEGAECSVVIEDGAVRATAEAVA